MKLFTLAINLDNVPEEQTEAYVLDFLGSFIYKALQDKNLQFDVRETDTDELALVSRITEGEENVKVQH